MKASIATLSASAWLLSSCAVFNPYIPTANIDQGTQYADVLSQKLRSALQSKATQLAYWQSGSTVTLATLLGLGGYQAVTSGGAHHVAALAIGAATLYGANSAFYDPVREQTYHRAVLTLDCIDGTYRRYRVSRIEGVAKELEVKYPEIYNSFRESYISARAKALEINQNYRLNLLVVADSVNSSLATLQPSAEATYQLLSGKINSVVKAPPASLKVFSRNDSDELMAQLLEWIAMVESAPSDFDRDVNARCNFSSVGKLSLSGIEQNQLIVLNIGDVQQYFVQNSSGSISYSLVSDDPADSGALSVKIGTNSGVYWLEVKALKVTKSEIKLLVIDLGAGKSIYSVRVKVN